MLILKLIVSAVIGYFLGDISCGIIIARLFGHIDIRSYGSGNAGTTNVLRTLGWLPSILTLVGDALKAFLAAKIGCLIGGDACLLVGGLCAVVGHNWPVFLGFKGGKGIAPSLGMIVAINPLIGLLLLIGQFVIVGVTGYMSVASIVSAIMFPVWVIILMHGVRNFALYLIFALIACGMALYSHRSNIRRLLNREENKLDFSKIRFLEKLKRK